MNHKLFLPCLQKGFYLLFMAVLITGLVGPIQGVSAASNSSSHLKSRNVITVEALIDGRSQLILRRNIAQWHHFDFAAPGRHEFANLPTTINDKEWSPVWPDVPDAENRDCNCYSDVFKFKGVKPGVHQNHRSVEINVLQGRGSVTILEYPSKANRNALVVEFDDNDFDGSMIYEVQLTFQSSGKP